MARTLRSHPPTSRITRRTLLLLVLTLAAVIAGLLYRGQPPTEPISPSAELLSVRALDVGQGDCFLILTPGGKSLLIDAGPPEAADQVIQTLHQHGIRQLDLVVATHPHADHIGGMAPVLDEFSVRMFLDSGQPHPSRIYTRMLEKIRDKGIRFVTAEAGQEFELDSGITLQVLAPFHPLIKWSRGSVINTNSIVLRLTHGRFSMLFTGDSEQETEEQILASYPELSAQVLKVAHHGSRYATTMAYLEHVRPEVAIISCGRDNRYGHPAQPTLNRLRKVVRHVYRTDLEGQITIYSDGQSYRVQTERPASGDVWAGRTPPGPEADRPASAVTGGGAK